jgi:hypothetical protein
MAPVPPIDTSPRSVFAVDRVSDCIVKLQGRGCREGLGSVSKELRRGVLASVPPGEEALFQAVDAGCVGSVERFLAARGGSAPHNGFLAHAIFNRDLAMMASLEGAGCRRSALTSLAAAASGRPEFLTPAAAEAWEVEVDGRSVRDRCVEQVCAAAARFGDVAAFEAARAQGYPVGEACVGAAMKSTLRMAEHVLGLPGVEWSPDDLCERAAHAGQFDKLSLVSVGARRVVTVCAAIAGVRREIASDDDVLAALRWAVANGFRLGASVFHAAASVGRFAIVRWVADKLGGSAILHSGILCAAFQYGSSEDVEWMKARPGFNPSLYTTGCLTGARTPQLFRAAVAAVPPDHYHRERVLAYMTEADVIRAAVELWWDGEPPTSLFIQCYAVWGGVPKLEALGYTSALDERTLTRAVEGGCLDSARWLVSHGTPWLATHSETALQTDLALASEVTKWAISERLMTLAHFSPSLDYNVAVANVRAALKLGVRVKKVDINRAARRALERGDAALLDACGPDAKVPSHLTLKIHWSTYDRAKAMGVKISKTEMRHALQYHGERMDEDVARRIAADLDMGVEHGPSHGHNTRWDSLYSVAFRRVAMLRSTQRDRIA